MHIGEQIRKLRKEMRLTQKGFASKLSLHPKLLAKYETGRTKPSAGVIDRIAKYCEVSTDYIIRGKDEGYTKRAKINDEELLDLFRRADNLKKPNREKIKWAIHGLLNNKDTANE